MPFFIQIFTFSTTICYNIKILNNNNLHLDNLNSFLFICIKKNMSHSLSKIFIHAVWHIKTTSPQIQKEDRQNLYKYVGGILKQIECIPICINGTGNHIHMFFVLSKNYSLVKVMSTVKIASSRWLKTIGNHYKNFAWQSGYGAFSVCESISERTINYIKKQEEHHKKKNFKEEYLQILKKHHMNFNTDYLFRD